MKSNHSGRAPVSVSTIAVKQSLIIFAAVISTASMCPPVRAALLYVSNNGNSTIEKLASNAVSSVFASANVSDPYGVAFDSAGNLLVANFGSNTITKFNSNGIGTTFASTNLKGPVGIAFDRQGALYVANFGDFTTVDSNTIVKFDTNGVASVFASGLNSPYGLAFDTGDNLYVANGRNSTVEKIEPNGSRSLFTSTNLNGPQGLAFDRAGNLYVSNFRNNTIWKFDPSKAGSLFATNSGMNSPAGLAFDGAGNLYVANESGNSIVKFTTNGVGSVFATAGLQVPEFLALTDDAGVPLPLLNQSGNLPYPPLSIMRNGGGIDLKWITTEAGLMLQQAGSVGSSTIWSNVNASVFVSGSTNLVQQNIQGDIPGRFYRLNRP